MTISFSRGWCRDVDCHCERSEAIPSVWHAIAAGAPKSGVPDFGKS
jgi:hypothetical protein